MRVEKYRYIGVRLFLVFISLHYRTEHSFRLVQSTSSMTHMYIHQHKCRRERRVIKRKNTNMQCTECYKMFQHTLVL